MVLLLTVFYIMADAFVYMPVRYIMFKDKLRYSYMTTMVFLFAISLIEGVLYYFLQNMVTSPVTNYVFRLIFMVVYICLSFYFINDNWQKVLFLLSKSRLIHRKVQNWMETTSIGIKDISIN